MHLKVARMWQVVSLEKRRSGSEWLSAMLIPSYNVVLANAYGSFKLQILFTFQVWARLFCRSMYFFVFVLSCDIKHFQQAEPKHYFDCTNWSLKFASGD